MPKCPKCDSEINHLKSYVGIKRIWRLSVAPDGVPEYLDIGVTDPDGEGSFECPECCEELFDNEDQAIAFLISDLDFKDQSAIEQEKENHEVA